MSTAITEASDQAENTRASFIRSRLGSLLAIAPLGVWTFIHLWNNLAAWRFREDHGDAWQSAVTDHAHPVAHFVTAIIVLLPLALHTAWGVGRLLTMRPNNIQYGFYGNLKYLLQRLSALGVVLFLGAHIWLAMLKPWFLEGHAEHFSSLASQMRNHPPTLVVYLLGTLGGSYPLANGVGTWVMGWGLVSSKRALRKFEIVSLTLFVVLLGMSWGVIYALYMAGAQS